MQSCRSALLRITVEGGVVVASIPLALAAESWWHSRNDQARVQGYLRAVSRCRS